MSCDEASSPDSLEGASKSSESAASSRRLCGCRRTYYGFWTSFCTTKASLRSKASRTSSASCFMAHLVGKRRPQYRGLAASGPYSTAGYPIIPRVPYSRRVPYCTEGTLRRVLVERALGAFEVSVGRWRRQARARLRSSRRWPHTRAGTLSRSRCRRSERTKRRVG